jgi:hypothetical protein
MNALAKAIQDDNLRFSPGLFLSGLKSHKLDSIQVNRQKRIVDRSREFSHVSRFVPQEFVEGTQEPYIVDSEVNASPLGHVPYCHQDGVAATKDKLRLIHTDIYTTLAARSSRPLNFARVCVFRIVISPIWPP